jgi:hypothetical protein
MEAATAKTSTAPEQTETAALTNHRPRRPPKPAAPSLLLRAAGQLKQQSRRRRCCGDKQKWADLAGHR